MEIGHPIFVPQIHGSQNHISPYVHIVCFLFNSWFIGFDLQGKAIAKPGLKLNHKRCYYFLFCVGMGILEIKVREFKGRPANGYNGMFQVKQESRATW